MRIRWTSTALPLLAAWLAILAPPASAAQPALHVIPFPNTPDASPQSQIIFSSLAPSELVKVTATGSSSGTHRGHLVRLPDDAGTAFVPANPFTPGETVTVTASLSSPQAGTAAGDPNATVLSYSFTVGVVVPFATSQATAPSGAGRTDPTRQPAFRSEPQLDPPPVHLTTPAAPGRADIFVSPVGSQAGAMIVNPRGQLVWFHPTPQQVAVNLEAQQYRGRPVLTWWQGRIVDGHGVDGKDIIVNQSYKPVATLRAGWGYYTNIHDFQLAPSGIALLDAYIPVQANLSSVGGPPNAVVLDFTVQEEDVRTGAVLWEWHALGHVPLSDSYENRPRSGGTWDPYHLNSIQQLPGHRLLVSFRHTWSVCEIDQLTGRVIWTLGGKDSSFKMGRGTNFEWQHDAHLYGHGLLTLFDDGSFPQEEQQSSAKELRIDLASHTVSLVHRYTHSPPLLAGAMGSTELLADHDLFVGWGTEPALSEYTPNGRQIFNATFPLGVKSYRAYRFPWTGHPLTRPSVAVSRSKKGVTWLYASWNGATQVARWRIVGGPTPHTLKPLKTKRPTGFETSIALPGAPRYLAAQALNAHGHVLGHSKTQQDPSP